MASRNRRGLSGRSATGEIVRLMGSVSGVAVSPDCSNAVAFKEILLPAVIAFAPSVASDAKLFASTN